jgi:hypothetical protein
MNGASQLISRTNPDEPQPQSVPGVSAESLPEHTQAAPSGPGKRAELSQGEVVPGSRYSSTEVDRALVAVAIEDGSTKRAARLLAKQGEPIGETTLRDWKNRLYPDRYLELQAKVLPRLNALAAEQHAAIATQASSLNVKILDRLEDVYEEIPVRDLPGAARNVATVAGIATDKAALLRGQGIEQASPTRSVSDILNALRAKGFDPSKLTLTQTVEVEGTDPAIEGTATEGQTNT